MGPQHPSTHGVLRIMMELDGEDGPAGQARHRLPPHRHGEDRRGAHVRAGRAPTSRAWTTRRRSPTSSCTRWRSSGCSTSRRPAARDVDPHAAGRAQPHVVAPAVPGHERHGHRRGVDDALRLARARGGAALLRDHHRPADEPQLHPPRRCRGRPARRLARRRARRCCDLVSSAARRVRRAADREPDLAGAHAASA